MGLGFRDLGLGLAFRVEGLGLRASENPNIIWSRLGISEHQNGQKPLKLLKEF